jgi:IQ and ubiquitin-like domain-containing protein
LPDIITVYVPVSNGIEGETKQLVVEIENKAIVKPFLGGYLNKRSSEYYIASDNIKPTLV